MGKPFAAPNTVVRWTQTQTRMNAAPAYWLAFTNTAVVCGGSRGGFLAKLSVAAASSTGAAIADQVSSAFGGLREEGELPFRQERFPPWCASSSSPSGAPNSTIAATVRAAARE